MNLIKNNNYTNYNNTKNHGTFKGTLIPEQWYKEFVDKRGNPDFCAISILSEIVYWYRPQKHINPNNGKVSYRNKFKGDTWQTCYSYLEKKFNFNRQRIRRTLVYLEQKNIINREFRTIEFRGQKYNNRLFIHLSDQFLKSLSCNSTAITTKKNSSNISSKAALINKHPTVQIDHPSLQFAPDNKKNRDENNNIDLDIESSLSSDDLSKSNFNDLCFESKKTQDINTLPHEKEHDFTLKNFYPLIEEDAKILRYRSGREFNLSAINEILLDISTRLKDRRFETKESFMSYMSKLLKYEKRQAAKINNTGFRINNNISPKEKQTIDKNKYLSSIEQNTDTSKESIFKRRLCCILPVDIAYNLLRNYRGYKIEDDIFRLDVNLYFDWNILDKNIILSQIRDIFNPKIKDIEIRILSSNDYNYKRAGRKENLDKDSIWSSIRKSLIKIYGADIDSAWFSKLNTQIDENNKNITISAPNNFIRNWIKSHYYFNIEDICNQYGYNLCEIT